MLVSVTSALPHRTAVCRWGLGFHLPERLGPDGFAAPVCSTDSPAPIS